MKKIFLLLFCFCFAQDNYSGTVNFNYNGTVNNNFTSLVQDTLESGIAFNQIAQDTSYFVFGSVTQQDENQFDLFFGVLRDTIFPVQPRTWDIPGSGNENNPLSLETILVLIPGLDSSFVIDLFENLSDDNNMSDSLDLDSLFLDVFSELSNDLYLGISGELEILNTNDSTVQGSFNTTMLKPAFNFPPHIVLINNGQFEFSKIASPNLQNQTEIIIANKLELSNAYPNPFNPTTNLSFNSNYTEIKNISLSIYDLNGRKLEVLMNGPIKPGYHNVQWNASHLPSGIYVARLESQFNIQTTKLILLK